MCYNKDTKGEGKATERSKPQGGYVRPKYR